MSEPLSDYQIDEWLAGRLKADPERLHVGAALAGIDRLVEKQRAAAAEQQAQAEAVVPAPRQVEPL